MTRRRREPPSVFRDDLCASVASLSYHFADRIGMLLLPSQNCPDMRGTIALFTAIDPEVLKIETYSAGDRQRDTTYVREPGGEWSSQR